MNTPIQQLSPLRNTTSAQDVESLAAEQLRHFGIDPQGDYSRALFRLACALDAHPDINVHGPAAAGHPNAALRRKLMYLELPAPLFTIDLQGGEGRPPIPKEVFKRYFDSLEPAIGLQVSLGQTNTLALCPALTSHSELSAEALKAAGITPTTIRISVGLEDPRVLIAHLQQAARLFIEPCCPGFCAGFPAAETIDALYRETYLDVHRRFIEAQPDFVTLAG